VRVGNAAADQFQLDVYGELLDLLYQCRRHQIAGENDSWPLECVILEFLESCWHKPDDGLWEIRGPRRHFTHSKVMAWVAFDRAVKSIEQFHCKGPVDRWRAVRDQIHADVCRHGYSAKSGSFTQSYDSDDVDASLLMLPMVGFLPAHDPRILGTVAAVEKQLMHDGLVLRYNTQSQIDGLPPGEGTFLPCSFWLADTLGLAGRRDDACRLFERLLDLRNDLGLISEEYDPRARRLVGNFPQAFTHVGLLNTAFNLTSEFGPAKHRQA
jgi:GH15 family glucan-1,4-alpha-glucosidase